MSDNAFAEEAVNKDVAVKKEHEELSFEEKVADLMRFVQFEPLIREIDYKVLVYCFERRGLSDIEEHIAGMPEFKSATRDQYSLVTELVRHHGLAFFELDAAGNQVTEEDKKGLTENEVDDLVEGFAYRTTDVGREAAARLDPRRRLAELLEAVPRRRDAYAALLAFVRDKRSFAQIDSFMRTCDVAELSRAAGDGGVQPSVYVDKLERAGAIFYDGGWQATEAALEFLDADEQPARD